MVSKIKIVFENDNLLVIDKKAGITVNRSDTSREEETVQDLLEQERKFLPNDLGDEFVLRAGIVHRLDKETSGLLIIAKNSESFKLLQLQFKNREVEKSYIALAHGQIFPKEGEISAPVGRLPWNRKRFGILAGGRESTTFYKNLVLYQNPLNKETLTLVNLFPKTGRTHQIRVHLKFINHPIFGDPLYGGRKTAREDRKILGRVFLHAQTLSFKEPKTGEKIDLKSSLPSELTDLLEKFIIKSDN